MIQRGRKEFQITNRIIEEEKYTEINRHTQDRIMWRVAVNKC